MDRTRARHRVKLVISAADRYGRVILLAGIVLSFAVALWQTAMFVDTGGRARNELTIQGDVKNLYFAASAAKWSDIPRWFVGPWNSPGIGYFRPLTSILFFLENKAFDRDFASYSRVGWILHGLNAALLYALVVSLLRHHTRARPLYGLLAVVLFATPSSSLFFSVVACVNWWPAQNDPLSLIFSLGCLILLDQYLVKGRRALLWWSALALCASIGAKEMGFIAFPMAAALIWWRRGRPTWEVTPFAAVAGFLWVYRRLVVPNPWAEHMFPSHSTEKAAMYWLEPLTRALLDRDYWIVAAGAAIIVLVCLGIRFRWRAWLTVALCIVVAGVCAQFIPEPGSWAMLLMPVSLGSLLSLLAYVAAVVLFVRYCKTEPGMPAAAIWALAYVPILQFAGYHYLYWPGAYLAIVVTVYWACLVRVAAEALGPRMPAIDYRNLVLISPPEPGATAEVLEDRMSAPPIADNQGAT